MEDCISVQNAWGIQWKLQIGLQTNTTAELFFPQYTGVEPVAYSAFGGRIGLPTGAIANDRSSFASNSGSVSRTK